MGDVNSDLLMNEIINWQKYLLMSNDAQDYYIIHIWLKNGPLYTKSITEGRIL